MNSRNDLIIKYRVNNLKAEKKREKKIQPIKFVYVVLNDCNEMNEWNGFEKMKLKLLFDGNKNLLK